MSKLSQRALLVSLNISQWDARRLDKAETEAVEIKHGTVKRAARVHKSLLPGAATLDAVHKASAKIRSEVYKNTLPWSEGMQIIKAEGYLPFADKMRGMRDEWEQLVRDFVADYPRLVQDAQRSLGTLFNADDYPDQSTVAERFSMNTRYLPVPDANDWRVDLGDENVAELRASVEEQVREAQQAAMNGAWGKLHEVVQRAQERLADPKAIFRDSLVDNALDVCAVLKTLNITDDPKLEAVRRKVEQVMSQHNVGTLRKDAAVRSNTASRLAEINKRMGAMYGA